MQGTEVSGMGRSSVSPVCLHAPSVDFYLSKALRLALRWAEYILLHLFMYNTSMVCRWGGVLSQITKWVLTTAFWILLNKDIATGNSGA